MNEEIRKHYQELFKKHGVSSEALQYSDKSSQFKRFEILSQIDSNLKSVVDIGCGLGHFYQFLKHKNFNGIYLGLDYVQEFVVESKKIYSEETNAEFKHLDIISGELEKGYDYVFLSGVFNNKFENNKEFMEVTIRKMFDASSKGIAFNAMSTYVDYQDSNLYYSNPLEIFEFCKKNISSKVTLRHDYLVKENSIPFEYCIYVYR